MKKKSPFVEGDLFYLFDNAMEIRKKTSNIKNRLGITKVKFKTSQNILNFDQTPLKSYL